MSAPRRSVSVRVRGAGAALVILTAAIAGCARDGEHAASRSVDSSGVGATASLVTRPVVPSRRYGTIGRRATPSEIAAWDIDVNPAGVGLPPGKGTYAEGVRLYAAKCAACHGVRGEGLAIYPPLIVVEPKAGFPFANDYHAIRAIGNYWPYATTLYDYIGRAMPLTAPGSLSPSERYSLVDFLLAENGVIGRGTVMDARTLPAVQMPARRYFVADDRTGGRTFR